MTLCALSLIEFSQPCSILIPMSNKGLNMTNMAAFKRTLLVRLSHRSLFMLEIEQLLLILNRFDVLFDLRDQEIIPIVHFQIRVQTIN